jgi:hypothetical protein
MAKQKHPQYIKGSKYKYVTEQMTSQGKTLYRAHVSAIKHLSYHLTERAAALAVDIAHIKVGKKPKNILIPLKNDTGTI